jgi:hypothetical protein
MLLDDVSKDMPSTSSVTQKDSNSSQLIKHIGNIRAKEHAREIKPQEDKVQIFAQDQKLMAKSSLKRLKVLENSTYRIF